MIKLFISLCDQCVSRRIFPKPVVGKPIVSVGFMTRMQVDLVDMRSSEYNNYKWIFHAKDHFSKYSWLFPMVSKEAINVAHILQLIFYQFGPPKILQSDNGREFVAKVITDLTKIWPSLLIINGRPRHPQSQGLVERSNSVVRQLLGKWFSTNNSLDWPSGLGTVMFAINTSIAKSTNKTPFEVVFGQHPRTEDDVWKNILNCEQQSSVEIANIVKEMDDVEPQSAFTNDDNNIEELNANGKITHNEDPEESNSTNDQNQEMIIDHEECVGEAGLLPNIDDLNIIPNSNDRHQQVRDEAEQSYLKNAQSQLIKYKNSAAKRRRKYVISDIDGLKVSDVDRTNTSSTILPCKIVDKYSKNDEFMHIVATQNGILKEHFESTAFLDLTSANFASLRSTNTDDLPTITFIQASQIYTNFKSTETCKCSGDCNTNRCCCKKNNRKCCTKCHSDKKSKCKNCSTSCYVFCCIRISRFIVLYYLSLFNVHFFLQLIYSINVLFSI
jgi:hypothetical protein